MSYILKPISDKDYKFLYYLLQQRESKECISHKKNPTWEKHIKFCQNHPYKEWNIVYKDDIRIGSLYITKLDEVGIHFIRDYPNNVFKEILELCKDKIRFANVSPNNKKLQNILKREGFKLIQLTYEKTIL